MASAWGGSWGASWGGSWGTIGPVVVVPPLVPLTLDFPRTQTAARDFARTQTVAADFPRTQTATLGEAPP